MSRKATLVMVCPSLEQIELALPWAARQNVSAALQEQASIIIEANGAVRSIELFFDHERDSAQRPRRDDGKFFVPGLHA
jgi:hypothetical protein